jgi:membrane fusion protein (multidrug efflux system)
MPGVEPTVSTGRHLVLVFAMVGILTTCTGCSNQTSAATKPVPPVVEAVEVQQKDVPVYNEWIGTLDGYVNADIKAQVSDYLLEQAYKEGSVVKKGQLLFQIDPRPFQAALDQAQGQLAQAQGQLAQARQPSRWFNFTQLGGTPNPPAAEFFHTSLEACGLFG